MIISAASMVSQYFVAMGKLFIVSFHWNHWQFTINCHHQWAFKCLRMAVSLPRSVSLRDYLQEMLLLAKYGVLKSFLKPMLGLRDGVLGVAFSPVVPWEGIHHLLSIKKTWNCVQFFGEVPGTMLGPLFFCLLIYCARSTRWFMAHYVYVYIIYSWMGL